MANKLATRRELLDRWRGIEEEADEDDDRIDASKRHRLHQNKEQWSSLSLLCFNLVLQPVRLILALRKHTFPKNAKHSYLKWTLFIHYCY